MAFVYILRCADGSLYVGWTEDVDSRIAMHSDGRGGSYTRHRLPVTLAFLEAHDTAEGARRRERQIKRWSAAKKEALVAGDTETLKRLAVSHASPRFRSRNAERDLTGRGR